MFSTRLEPRARRMTRAVLLTSALGLSLLVTTPAFAADECGSAPPGGGSVTCTTTGNTYPDGVTYTPPADLTVVLDPGVAINRINGGASDDALSINVTGSNANVAITGGYAQVSAGAGLRDGISVIHDYGSTGTTTIDAYATAYGQRRGVNVYGGGDVNISISGAKGGPAGGGYSGGDGIHVEGLSPGSKVNVQTYYAASSTGSGMRIFGATDGNISIDASSVMGAEFGVLAHAYGTGSVHVGVGYALGANDSAISVIGADGDIQVSAGEVKSANPYSAAVDIKSFGSGSIDVSANTVNAKRTGISARGYGTGNVNVDAGAVYATDRTGIYAYSHAGNIDISAQGVVGNRAGVAAVSNSGDITLNIAANGGVAATGPYGAAIYASSDHGAININAQDTTVVSAGAGSRGIDVFAGGDKDITINAGTVIAAGSSAPGYDNDAIHVRQSGTGAVTITAGVVGTYGDSSDAVWVRGNGPISVTSGIAVATGYSGRGVDVRSTYGPVTVDVGAAVAVGDEGEAIIARSDYGDVSVQAQAVVATGKYGRGVVARSYGGNVSVAAGQVITYSEGVTASTTGAGNIDIALAAGGGIGTTGYDGAGIVAEADKGSINITAGEGSIIGTLGPNAQGVSAVAKGPGSINIDVDTVLTTGPGQYDVPTGIYARQAGGGNINIAAKSVTTVGQYAYGIEAHATTGLVEITSGKVVTGGYGADAIHVAGGRLVSITSTGDVTTYGDRAMGISANTGGSVHIDNQGAVHTYGGAAPGISVHTINGNVAVASNAVVAEQSVGIYAKSDHGAITVNAADTTSHGGSTDAILVAGDRSVTVNAGSTTATGATASAIDAHSTGGNVVVTAHDVESNGWGVVATSATGATRVDLVSAKSYRAGVLATGDTAATVNLAANGQVHTYGALGYGVIASAHGPVSVTAGAGSQIITEGNSAAGISASGSGGVTVAADTVQTQGMYSRGISASLTGAGKIDIVSRSVSTAGLFAQGIYAYAAAAPISIVSGDVVTGNASSDAIHAVSGSSVTIATTGETVTHGAVSYGVFVSGQGDVSVHNQGSVHTYGQFADGIVVRSFGDVSIVSNSVTAENGVGISAQATKIDVQAESTSATGAFTRAIQTLGGDSTVTAGQVSAHGYASYGVFGAGWTSSVTIKPGGQATAVGDYSTAILAFGTTGSSNVTTTDATVSAQGAQAVGVFSDSKGVGATAGAWTGTTTVSGDRSIGVLAIDRFGDADITAQTTSASGARAIAVRATALHDAHINAGDVTGVGDHVLGVSAVAGYGAVSVPLAASGDAIVVTTGTVGVTGAGAIGVAALTGGGTASIDSNVVRADGAAAFGVRGRSLYGGQVNITAADVAVTGAGSTAIFGRGYGGAGLSIWAGQASSDGGRAIDALTDGGNISIQAASASGGPSSAAITVLTPGNVTLSLGDVSGGTEAVLAGAGQFHISTSAGSTVRGGTGPAIWLWQSSGAQIDNAGTLRADSGFALEADSGPVTLNNTGMVIGSVWLAGGDDKFNNAAGATFAASTSDFGGGTDVLNNSGAVRLAASGGPVTVTLAGLEQFNNAGGSIDLTGRGPGDRLVLPGGFAASGSSQLKVDAYLGGAGSIADVLKVNGAVTGSTAVSVKDANTGAGAYNPDGILVVDASGGASAPAATAFTLAGGPIVKGLWSYNLYAKPDKTFVLASVPSATAFDTPYLASAVQGLFAASLLTLNDRLDDIRSTQVASSGTVRLAALASDVKTTLPAPSEKDNGVWARIVGGHETRDATQSVSLLGTSTTYSLGYRQSYVAFQSGFDHAVSQGPATLVFGASLGYADASGDFQGGGSFHISGMTGAVYAEYLRGGFFGHVVGQGEWLTTNYQSSAGTAKPHSQAYGISAGGGYRYQQAQWFFEPTASLDWASVSMDQFSLQGTAVSFRDGDMLRGRAALNIGQVIHGASGKTQIEPTLTVGVAHAFEGGASAIFASGPGVALADNARPTWGEFGFGVRVIDLGSGVSGFVRGQYDGLSKEYSGYSFKAGLKIRF
jgi:outer membrane autotransporter protein